MKIEVDAPEDAYLLSKHLKKDKWTRDTKNRISKIIDIIECGRGTWKHKEFKMSNKLQIKFVDKFVAVADTPQELACRGDLITVLRKNGKVSTPYVVSDNYKNHCAIYEDFKSIEHKDIYQIYTPNKDKTQYTEQWRANK